jgi:hypothetical protein
MNNREEGVSQLVAVVKNYAKTPEAGLATQQLQRVAPEALDPAATETAPPKRPTPDNTRKPRKAIESHRRPPTWRKRSPGYAGFPAGSTRQPKIK